MILCLVIDTANIQTKKGLVMTSLVKVLIMDLRLTGQNALNVSLILKTLPLFYVVYNTIHSRSPSIIMKLYPVSTLSTISVHISLLT